MKRRHFLKALAVVAGTVSLAPRLAIAATLEEATRPYVIRAGARPISAWPISEVVVPGLREYGAFVKVSDLTTAPLYTRSMLPLTSTDPLTQYGIQGWKVAFMTELVRPQDRVPVLANLTRPLSDGRMIRAPQ